MQNEIERRAKVFEIQRAKNLEEQLRIREKSLAARFKLGSIEELAGYVDYDTDQINMVAEKQIHMKYTPRQYAESKLKLSVKQLVCEEMHERILMDNDSDGKSDMNAPGKANK